MTICNSYDHIGRTEMTSEELDELMQSSHASLMHFEKTGDERVISSILREPYCIYRYCIITGKLIDDPKIKGIIAQDPCWSFWYSYKILKGRFKECEQHLTKDIWYHFLYSINVIELYEPGKGPADLISKYPTKKRRFLNDQEIHYQSCIKTIRFHREKYANMAGKSMNPLGFHFWDGAHSIHFTDKIADKMADSCWE